MKEFITIKFHQNDKLCYCNYFRILDPVIANWAGSGMVRIFKAKVFIKPQAFGYFNDLTLRQPGVKCVITYTPIGT